MFQSLKKFIISLSNDERIPRKDILTNKILFILLLSPIDFIPDWIEGWGLVDDLIVFCLLCDYWSEIVEQNVILTHYPWSMKRFTTIQKIMKTFGRFSPSFISNHLWKYERSPF